MNKIYKKKEFSTKKTLNHEYLVRCRINKEIGIFKIAFHKSIDHQLSLKQLIYI